MALSYDTKLRIPATALATTAANPITADYTCGANAKILIVMVLYAGNVQRTGGSPTYNNVALSQAESLAGVTEAVCELWYLQNPPTGSALPISIPNTNTVTAWVYVVSVNAAAGYVIGVDDTGITETTGESPLVTLVTSVANTFLVACVASGDNSFAPTGRTGTSLYEEDIATYGGAAQYHTTADIGSIDLVWTESTSDDYGALGIALKESSSSSSTSSSTTSSSTTSSSTTSSSTTTR